MSNQTEDQEKIQAYWKYLDGFKKSALKTNHAPTLETLAKVLEQAVTSLQFQRD